MAQHDYDIANQTFPATRSDINSVLDAIQSTNSGTTAPSSVVACQAWADTTSGLLKFRNIADTAWLPLDRITSDFVQAAKIGAYTVQESDFGSIIPCDTSGGAFTITLPTASGREGFRFTIYKSTSDANAVTIDGNASETINGALTRALSEQWASIYLVSDGTNWVAQDYNIVTTDSTQTIAGVKTFSDFNNSFGFVIGQCRMVRDGANLRLNPYNGNKIYINGVWRSIPDAGVALAATSTAATTVYYIYAYWTGSAIALEFSTTAPATQAGTGLRIKNGDATRTLVGMARTASAGAWSTAPLEVRSWFNRQILRADAAFTTTRSTASTSWVELNTEIRVPFLVWTGEVVVGSLIAQARMTPAVGTGGNLNIGFAGTAEGASTTSVSTTNQPMGMTKISASTLTEGTAYFVSVYGRVLSTNTIEVFADGTTDNSARLAVTIGGGA